MFPRIGDLLYGVFGLNVKIPAQTFGFFVALAFVGAYFVIRAELRRKERLGHYQPADLKLVTAGPMPLMELIFPTLIWTFVAWKVGYAFVDYDLFYRNTQEVVLSTRGWWVSALVVFLGFGIPRYLAWKKSQSVKVVTTSTTVGPSYYMNLSLTLAFFAGIFGAKFATYIEEPSHFFADPIHALFSFDGLAFYGGLLFAAFVICYFFYRQGFNVLTCIDGFAPGLILAYAIGRMGCHFSGDGDWGVTNLSAKPGWLSWLPDWAWAYDYPHNVAHMGVPIPGCEGEFCNHLAQPAWPTPLYEITMSLLIFAALLIIRKKVMYSGQLTAIYMVMIGTERLIAESLRYNMKYRILGMVELTQAEIISILLIGGGIFLFYWITWRKKPAYPGKVPLTF
jgi:phosphatidylglycerol---prolipoprotein diacylglyceryl transferase